MRSTLHTKSTAYVCATQAPQFLDEPRYTSVSDLERIWARNGQRNSEGASAMRTYTGGDVVVRYWRETFEGKALVENVRITSAGDSGVICR